ncbi:hypothetical protein H0W80_02765 [Candidatus Saccharibacteria bacterium]|nr:hypothetical protein [Candidatus Saccharibacteria bacterium]
MQYEETPTKNSKGLGKAVKDNDLEKINTGAILWHLVKRHRFSLVTVWAIVITILYMFPFVPDMILSLFKSL